MSEVPAEPVAATQEQQQQPDEQPKTEQAEEQK